MPKGTLVKSNKAIKKILDPWPCARAYLPAHLTGIPSNLWVKVRLAAENFDLDGNFDSSEKIGLNTAVVASLLIDDTLSPFVPADVGRGVWNATDGRCAMIDGYISTSRVHLSADIFTATGKAYKAYMARFTAPITGYYQVNAAGAFYQAQSLGRYEVAVKKNGTTLICAGINQHGDYVVGCNVSDIVYLEGPEVSGLPHYLELWAYHYNSAGNAVRLHGTTEQTYMSIVKLYIGT